MPYVSSSQRVGRREGLLEGIETALRIRFGADGLKLLPEIHPNAEEEQLRLILKALETTTSLDEVRQSWTMPARS